MNALYPGPSAGAYAVRGAALGGRRGLTTAMVVAIVAAYIIPGLVGHDPWKQDEAYVFGGILDMLKSGDWVVVKVGGIPFLEKPPMYHWMAAITAMLFSPFLALHDAARLASGVFTALAVAGTALAARVAWGRGHGRIGALMMLAPLGLQTNAQMMLPDLPLMAGFALAIAGLAGCSRERWWGGALLGLGVGLGFLGKGLLAPATLGVAAAALPIVFPAWRRRRYRRDLLVALAVAAPFLLAWPAILWARSPELFSEWFWDNNVGRYLGFSVARLGAATESGYWLETLPWFLFPLWIFPWSHWLREGRRYLAHPGAQIGLIVSGCAAIVLLTSASSRSIYALPMVPALALAAAGSLGVIGPRVARSLFVLGVALAGATLAIVWCVWASLVARGHAPDWPWLLKNFPDPFPLPFSAPAFLVAGALTLGFAAICLARRPGAERALATWVGAVALAWSLPALLWLPWIDHAKSYRDMYLSMARAIPAGVDCVATLELGESERAMLEYVLAIPTLDPAQGCRAVLRQMRTDRMTGTMPAVWRLAWSGSRPGDTRERFELWLRPRAGTPAERVVHR